jgi:hypothetical protein
MQYPLVTATDAVTSSTLSSEEPRGKPESSLSAMRAAPIQEQLERLESRYEIFKVRLFKEYRKYVFFNLFTAGLLAIILTVLAFKAGDPITQGWEWTTIFMPALSVLPGPISVAVLWFDASRQVKPMRKTADELEERATRSVVQRSPK